jgi:uncharacterized protein YjbJ (UPF0337 family)
MSAPTGTNATFLRPKEAAGKVLGDKKLETEGTTEKAAGKVQNAIGGLKDAVRGK